MKNFDKLLYTYKHRKILIFLAKKYCNSEELLERLQSHDMDKMYLLLFYPKSDIEAYHRSLALHHDNDKPKTELDYMEMVLDWESARYTKEDKPFNAYDTLCKFYPQLKEEVLPILKKLGIDKSTLKKEKDVVSFAETLSNITVEDIKKELIEFIEKTKNYK